MRKLPLVARLWSCAALCVVLLTGSFDTAIPAVGQSVAPWPEIWRTDSSFQALWARTDAPVAAGSAARSWLWGPEPFAVANELYDGSPTGLRLVEYLDKGRMELSDPAADRASAWFVTSGLLVREMVLGQIQVGANRFLPREPAAVPVTGDPGAAGTPAYAEFGQHLERAPDKRGQVVGEAITAAGDATAYAPTSDAGLFVSREYDDATGHNIPAVFVDWAQRKGLVLESGQILETQVMDRLLVLGRPIAEPYWVDTTAGGRAVRVLVQLFERRTLTYNPSNPADWRVEMGNVGRAYYEWRYGSSPPGPAVAVRADEEGLTVAGWNWPSGAAVQVQVELAGGADPLSGPLAGLPNETGYFALRIAGTPSLNGAVASGANMRVVAEGAGGKVALPFRVVPDASTSTVEGMLSQVSHSAGGMLVTLTSTAGTQQRLLLQQGAALRFAEGGTAGVGALQVGAYAVARGSEQNGAVQVSRLDMLSVSSAGAIAGYTWSGSTRLRVAGRGWPARQQVTFGIGRPPGEPTTFATLDSDSRGNLSGIAELPPLSAQDRSRLWLLAATDSVQGAARVWEPLGSLGTASAPPPPQAFTYSDSGGQSAAAPSLCPAWECRPARAVALPLQALEVTPGEVLGLRVRRGADPLAGPSPTRLAFDLFRIKGDPASEFVAAGPPTYSSGDLPGRPLSMSVPQGLPAGRYALLLRTSWPGLDGTLVYGFVLQVP